ncbi:MAG: KEOPS complex kinase/ATPase Bud32 [Candidatus Hodarchaeales archaeon]
MKDKINTVSMDEILIYGNIINKGAEAYIYQGKFLDTDVIIKERKPKPYRHPDLDKRLRKGRIRAEMRVLNALLSKGVNVPEILAYDSNRQAFAMEMLEGQTLQSFLETVPVTQSTIACENFGFQTGLIHSGGIHHGDLTPFNAITFYNNGLKVYIIDFGLSGFTVDLDTHATDLMVLKSTLEGYFPEKHGAFFESFRKGYCQSVGSKRCEQVFDQMSKIKLRGRYASREDRKELGTF